MVVLFVLVVGALLGAIADSALHISWEHCSFKAQMTHKLMYTLWGAIIVLIAGLVKV
ncbi:MAG: hypothetical protein V1846_03250 [Candidatus Komeilibacteria bacterium]